MSKLGNLLGKGDEIVLQGETFKIIPLKVKDLKDMKDMDNASAEEKFKFGIDLIKKCLQDSEGSFPTEEEIEKLTVKEMGMITEAIAKLNGMKDDKLEGIKKRISP